MPTNWDKIIFNVKYSELMPSSIDDDALKANEVSGFRGAYTALTVPIRLMRIKKVIFNAPATIVYWQDGTKTVVKANNEPFDREKRLAMAIAKKALGNKGNFNNVFREWIK